MKNTRHSWAPTSTSWDGGQSAQKRPAVCSAVSKERQFVWKFRHDYFHQRCNDTMLWETEEHLPNLVYWRTIYCKPTFIHHCNSTWAQFHPSAKIQFNSTVVLNDESHWSCRIHSIESPNGIFKNKCWHIAASAKEWKIHDAAKLLPAQSEMVASHLREGQQCAWLHLEKGTLKKDWGVRTSIRENHKDSSWRIGEALTKLAPLMN